jgi:hypothetical protein
MEEAIHRVKRLERQIGNAAFDQDRKERMALDMLAQ